MLAELKNFKYWDAFAGKWITNIPAVSVNHWVGLACEAYNPTQYNQYFSFYFMATDPLGNYVDSWSSPYYLVKPGTALQGNFTVWATRPGNYSMFVAINVQGYGSAATDIRIVALVEGVVEYSAIIDTWDLWQPATQTWGRPSPTLVPLNSQIGIRCKSINKSATSIYMRQDIVKQYPNGVLKTMVGETKSIASNGLLITEFKWIAEQGGEYLANIILYAGGTAGTLVEVDRRGNLAVAFVQSLVDDIVGDIVKVEVEKNTTWVVPPTTGVVMGDYFRFRVNVKNISTKTLRFRLSYTIYKPVTGAVSEAWDKYIGAGATEQFLIGPGGLSSARYVVDEAGRWTLLLGLLVEGKVLDTYDTELFTVPQVEEPPPEGETGQEGLLKEIQILYGTGLFVGDLYTPPVSGVITTGWFKFAAKGYNNGPGTATMGIKWMVTKPDKSVLVGDYIEQLWTNVGSYAYFVHPAINAYTIDQAGEWSLKLELTRGLDRTVVDTWQGVIFTVEEAPATIWDLFGALLPLLILIMAMGMIMPMVQEPWGTVKKAGEVVKVAGERVIKLVL